jgi:hypothetical protein
MPLFSLKVDSFQITDTRSVHTDTNHAALSYSIGTFNKSQDTAYNNPEYGNYNNGTYPGNLVCPGLSILPDSPITFNYLILNAGFTNPNSAHGVLEDVGIQMTQGAPLPAFASCLQQVATQYAGTFNKILRPGCDGLVAAEQNTFAYEDLTSRTSGRPGTFTQTTTHIGPTIAHGCNPRPSHYIVHWSVSQVVAVPAVVGMSLGEAESQADLQWMVEKGCPTDTKKAYVQGLLGIAQGTFVPIGSPITLVTTLTPP